MIRGLSDIRAWSESIDQPKEVIDDRGAVRQVLRDPARLEQQIRLLGRARRTKKPISFVLWLCAYIMISLGLEAVKLRFQGIAPTWIVIISYTAVVLCVGWLAYALYLKAVRQKAREEGSNSLAQAQFVRRSFLNAAECPCCGYALGDVVPESDGCANCPECGAAWRLTGWRDEAQTYRFPAIHSDDERRTRPFQIIDGRGIPVRVLGRLDDRDRRRRLARETALPSSVVYRINGQSSLLALAIVATFVLLVWVSGFGIVVGGACYGPFVAALVLLACGRTASDRLQYESAKLLAQNHVARGLCPCCESPLRPTPSPIDACLLCDTCGCAWKPDATPAPAPNSITVPPPADPA